MRHGNKRYNIGVNSSHRRSLLRNLSIELIEHARIKTTITKCRAVKPYIEKIITIAKNDTVAKRRLVYSKLNNRAATVKLFKEIAPKVMNRNGGYTRIVKLADKRAGDGSDMAYISLVDVIKENDTTISE
ncbi:MAG: 50S ribosomal protein L17 [Oligoflexia bacterium]|nr:50S ribosomal protein L17 [Oligoflexia bacterium]